MTLKSITDQIIRSHYADGNFSANTPEENELFREIEHAVDLYDIKRVSGNGICRMSQYARKILLNAK